jgi:hypothetical protein
MLSPVGDDIYISLSWMTDLLSQGIALAEASKFFETQDGLKLIKESGMFFRIVKGQHLFVPAGMMIHIIGYSKDPTAQATPQLRF